MLDLTPQINRLAEAVDAARIEGQRLLVAIVGAPASGKSTLSEELARRLNAQKHPAQVVPMDGFHLDNRVLETRGLLPRKGAPETFDAAGFVHMIRRLKAGEEVAVPVFDRARDIAITGAVIIPADLEVVIIEGNYLLFNEAPWSDLAPLWDVTARISPPISELRGRLIQRWLTHGLSRTAATRRAEGNDIPNAERVIARALPAQIEF
ncbi:nucleoside/nucleotide kinase family protein [Marivivens marinus]|uniref:nucleoside/nucleotide kinase family protein n=1 Tax=Marivivens marinus TaxID=3110173 RepID=UPI003B8478B3